MSGNLLHQRDLIPFPPGDSPTDTLISGIHMNLTTLQRWGYQLYSNGTMSNGSSCILTFPPYQPVALIWDNGTFINSTWCFSPINPIGTRAKLGVGFAVAFGLSLVLTLWCLTRHGRLHLPAEKRFWPIGRRWQWYWMIFVCATAFISLMTSIDVDRYYVVELPIVLDVFFWFLMQMGAMAVVWEAVRHWGSWMERQVVDASPYVLPQDDRRGKFEFWLPLFFYLWLWLNFFLVIPRNWELIELQRSPEQTAESAAPAATDGRFKAAAICLFVCWLTTVVSLRHSIKHYRPRNRGMFNRAVGLIRFTPIRFLLILPISLAVVVYQAMCAWAFIWSPLDLNGNYLAIGLGGYTPSLLIIIVQIIAGFLNPNEDKELIRLRRLRGAEVDRDLGIVHKPGWWRYLRDNPYGEEGMQSRVARNVREVNGERSTARDYTAGDDAVEMSQMPPATSTAPTSGARVGNDPTVTASSPPPPPYTGRGRTTVSPTALGSHLALPATERSTSTATTPSVTGPPQQIRSMLDV